VLTMWHSCNIVNLTSRVEIALLKRTFAVVRSAVVVHMLPR